MVSLLFTKVKTKMTKCMMFWGQFHPFGRRHVACLYGRVAWPKQSTGLFRIPNTEVKTSRADDTWTADVTVRWTVTRRAGCGKMILNAPPTWESNIHTAGVFACGRSVAKCSSAFRVAR
ncbi:hypothetical protein Desdi_2555 [Desulfitobacterium dichloroeliminans LMG P-21439]|uniref:Uncharacterized protein n=1 Tax=Desulfitobacterium dichloroeliminans (strain LMG P-21439 / DCA1) TaxID=871963 RepID=L0F819_DESDL|nr:hypothetical protein Desdi_2555 [Desulfitobacterium dichloroeliminans LMG P-21439]